MTTPDSPEGRCAAITDINYLNGELVDCGAPMPCSIHPAEKQLSEKEVKMTDEKKAADAFAESLAGLEGATSKMVGELSSYEIRAQLEHDSTLATHKSIIAFNEAVCRGEDRRIIAMDEDREKAALYKAELLHVQAFREVEAAALNRIADALEKMAAK